MLCALYFLVLNKSTSPWKNCFGFTFCLLIQLFQYIYLSLFLLNPIVENSHSQGYKLIMIFDFAFFESTYHHIQKYMFFCKTVKCISFNCSDGKQKKKSAPASMTTLFGDQMPQVVILEEVLLSLWELILEGMLISIKMWGTILDCWENTTLFKFCWLVKRVCLLPWSCLKDLRFWWTKQHEQSSAVACSSSGSTYSRILPLNKGFHYLIYWKV